MLIRSVGRLVPLVVGLICLTAPSSYAASDSLTSDLDVEDVIAQCLPDEGPLYPLTEADDYSFDVTYDNTTATVSLAERDEGEDFIAKIKEKNVWRIMVQGNKKLDYNTLVADEEFWVGELWFGSVKLGNGAQGKVQSGTWQPYKSPVKANLTDTIDNKYLARPAPVAIKETRGQEGYELAKKIQRIKSANIVKTYIYAFRSRISSRKEHSYRSIVVYERLKETAEDVWKRMVRGRPSIGPSVMGGMIQVALDAEKHGFYNVDFKLEHIMTADSSQGLCTVWKSIDWDLVIEGGPYTTALGWVGTEGYLAPELEANRRGQELRWNVEKAVVWTLGMIALYLYLGDYPYQPTDAMRIYAQSLVKIPSADHHPIWWWVALMVAYEAGDKEIPFSIFTWEELSSLESSVWRLLVNTLRKEEDRITLREIPGVIQGDA